MKICLGVMKRIMLGLNLVTLHYVLVVFKCSHMKWINIMKMMPQEKKDLLMFLDVFW